jgi:branched-chain amino acid transport system substrate-binding protein
MYKRLVIAVTTAFALQFGALAWAQVIIGISVPLTGFAEVDGKSAFDGAKLSVTDGDAKGRINGEKIELVINDDETLPREATLPATKLIENDKVATGVSASYSMLTGARP